MKNQKKNILKIVCTRLVVAKMMDYIYVKTCENDLVAN